MKNKLVSLFTLIALPVLANTPPEITNVRASQRTDTKLVDIYYDAADADGDLLKVRIEISDNDGAKYSVPAFSLTGDIGEGIAAGKDKHIVWDAGTDWDGEYSDKMRVKVYAIDAQGFPGLEWGNEVPPGGFLMGQDGGAEGSGPSRHVNIPWSYWLSKYEITRKEFCEFLNVAYAVGKIEVKDAAYAYAAAASEIVPHHVERCLIANLSSFSGVRWNVNNFEAVGDDNLPIMVTWYGALAFANYYGYDLPTEAEWEKAARGPDYDDQDEHKIYPWGDVLNAACANASGKNLKTVGYYDGNQTPVGSDMINGYGLYDICGNAAEWTLTDYDSSVSDYPQQDDVNDDRNVPALQSQPTMRGGWLYQYDNYYSSKSHCYTNTMNVAIYNCSAGTKPTSTEYRNFAGFRVCRRLGVSRSPLIKEFHLDCENLSELSSSAHSYPTTIQDWVFNPSVYRTSTCHASGSYSLYIQSYGSYSSALYDVFGIVLPSSTNRIVAVSVKVKNTFSYEQTLYLYNTNSQRDSVSIPGGCDFDTFVLTPPADSSTLYLRGTDIYLDDITVWTLKK